LRLVDIAQLAQAVPADVGELAVGRVWLARDPVAPEDEVKVVDLVAVRVGRPRLLLDEGESCHADDDAGLLRAFAHGGVGRLLAGLHDARDALPGSVVGAPAEQDLLVFEHDRGHADEGERGMPDPLTQRDDELRGGHVLQRRGGWSSERRGGLTFNPRLR